MSNERERRRRLIKDLHDGNASNKIPFLWKMRNEGIINSLKQFDQVLFVCSTIFVNDVSLIIGISQSALFEINFLLLAA